MSPELTDTIGYIAGTITAFSLFPQIYKSWSSKSTKDISMMYSCLLMGGLILWVIYGYGSGSMPLLVFATIEALFTGSLVVLKLIYK